MVKFTQIDHLRGKLNGLNEPVEVCDETRFAAAAAKTPYSVEELKRRLEEKEHGGLPLAEIWKRLGR